LISTSVIGDEASNGVLDAKPPSQTGLLFDEMGMQIAL
jgi:hypothetical protein